MKGFKTSILLLGVFIALLTGCGSSEPEVVTVKETVIAEVPVTVEMPDTDEVEVTRLVEIEVTRLVEVTRIIEVEVTAVPTPEPTVNPEEIFAKYSSQDAIDAFVAAGLEAETPTEIDPFGDNPVPKTFLEGQRFLVPSLGEDRGGRVFGFESPEDLKQVQAYYEGLSGIVGSWVYVKDNLVFQVGNDLPKQKAEQYEAVMMSLGGEPVTFDLSEEPSEETASATSDDIIIEEPIVIPSTTPGYYDVITFVENLSETHYLDLAEFTLAAYDSDDLIIGTNSDFADIPASSRIPVVITVDAGENELERVEVTLSSPDLLPTSSYPDVDYLIEQANPSTDKVVGIIANNGNHISTFLEVIVVAYDAEGNVIGSNFTFPDDNGPGTSSPFEIRLHPFGEEMADFKLFIIPSTAWQK